MDDVKQGKRSPESPCLKNNNSNKEQDRFLPIANVGRIMKKVIPGNGKISKDAKETVQECVSEFISFVTGEASDKCQREKRKTINGDDILWAITTLGFDDYVEPLKLYLLKYRQLEATSLISQQHYATIGEQAFALPFSSNSINTQLHHQQESIDSVEQW
ncbi:Histone-fold [Artemisia annua]|uniref:Histone-fold n=1 Tax=Artemisia annua TaxID=35608 RepID=A0A2U1KS83_ARTAN|nr:Histone-fold [Artemisia annua]